jgi:ribosomal protein S27AE
MYGGHQRAKLYCLDLEGFSFLASFLRRGKGVILARHLKKRNAGLEICVLTCESPGFVKRFFPNSTRGMDCSFKKSEALNCILGDMSNCRPRKSKAVKIY